MSTKQYITYDINNKSWVFEKYDITSTTQRILDFTDILVIFSPLVGNDIDVSRYIIDITIN